MASTALTILDAVGVPSPVIERWRLFGNLPQVQKAKPLFVGAAALGFAVAAWAIIWTPPSRELSPGLSEADKNAVVSALTAANLSYAIDRSSGALTVSHDDFYKARMLLAAQGLPKRPVSGSATLDAMPLGSSHAVEQARLTEAREDDLARMIESVDGVEQARVRVAVPESSAFLRTEAQPRASIMLTLAGSATLSSSQAQAIVHLVASSVPDLSPDAVAIVDQRGRLLAGGSGSDPLVLESGRQIDLQARVEARYKEALARLLGPLVGPDAFALEVHADLNFDESQATRQSFPESGRAVQQEESQWTSDGADRAAVGIPGTLANQAPPAATVTTAPPRVVQSADGPPRTSENVTKSYQVGSEVSVSKAAVGTLRRLSVAVVFQNKNGKPLPKGDLAALENAIRGAVGFDAGRGDIVAVSSRAFTEMPKVARPWWTNIPVETIVRVAGGIVLLCLGIWGVVRPWWRANEARRVLVAPLLAAEISRQGSRGEPITLEMINAAPSYSDRATLVREFVTQDPKRAAAVVRSLLSDPKTGADV